MDYDDGMFEVHDLTSMGNEDAFNPDTSLLLPNTSSSAVPGDRLNPINLVDDEQMYDVDWAMPLEEEPQTKEEGTPSLREDTPDGSASSEESNNDAGGPGQQHGVPGDPSDSSSSEDSSSAGEMGGDPQPDDNDDDDGDDGSDVSDSNDDEPQWETRHCQAVCRVHWRQLRETLRTEKTKRRLLLERFRLLRQRYLALLRAQNAQVRRRGGTAAVSQQRAAVSQHNTSIFFCSNFWGSYLTSISHGGGMWNGT